jgi:hypothetical protein
LARWAEDKRFTASIERGRWREIYLATDDNDYANCLIEIHSN